MPSPKAIASASSSPVAAGAFTDDLNVAYANGYLKIKLALPDGSVASLTGGGEVAATEVVKITLDANGIPSAGQVMFMSDQFSSPVTPAFNVEIHNSNDRIVGTINGAVISGVAPVDLTSLVPTSNGASYINALILGTGTTTSLQLATALTDETGTGAAVFATSPTLVTPTLGVASSTQVSASNISGQSNCAFKASGAGTIGIGWNNTNGAADQKWADATLSTTSWLLRFVNDANSVGSTIMQATRGALSAVATIVFGSGGGVQTLFTSTDTIVGKATTDQMSNKALTGIASGNSVTLLNSQDSLGNITGNGADQTVYTFTIPANTVQAGKGIRLTFFAINNNAVAVTYKFTLGATTALTLVTSATAQGNSFTLEIFNNSGVQNAQVWTERAYDGATILSNNVVTSAENFANALALKVTANEAAANTIAPKKWIIELIQ